MSHAPMAFWNNSCTKGTIVAPIVLAVLSLPAPRLTECVSDPLACLCHPISSAFLILEKVEVRKWASNHYINTHSTDKSDICRFLQNLLHFYSMLKGKKITVKILVSSKREKRWNMKKILILYIWMYLLIVGKIFLQHSIFTQPLCHLESVLPK